MMAEQYQNVILGSGAGGKLLSWHLASSGQRTAVIERRWIGGSCPNVNCLPSKNEVFSAHAADILRHAAQYGIKCNFESIDMSVVRQRKRDMVDRLVAIHIAKYKASGAELIMGQARFTGYNTLEVQLNGGGVRTLTGQRVFVNVGTRATIPPVPGLAASNPMSNIELLELDRLPDHLIIIGGGYVGLEFAQAFRRFGSRITIIQRGPQLLSDQDPDVSAEMARILTADGIAVIAPAEVVRVEGKSGSAVTLTLRTASGESIVSGSDILVAAGRTPNTDGIGLEQAGIELDCQGFVKVDDQLRTTAPNVWAIGECAGSPQFTHASEDDFRIIRDNLAGQHRSTRNRLVPSCLFTEPQLAQVGLTETEARRRNIPYELVKVPTNTVLRTLTTGQSDGFLKTLINPADGRILGFTMIGSEAGEVMAAVQIAMLGDLPYSVIRDAVLTHPTMAEGLGNLYSAAKTVIPAKPPAASDGSQNPSPAGHPVRTTVYTKTRSDSPAAVQTPASSSRS